MADILSDDQPTSNPVLDILIFIVTQVIAGCGCIISTIATAFAPQPPQRPTIENFVIRITHDSLEKRLHAPRGSMAPPASDPDDCDGARPRSGSDPTGTVSRPEVDAERKANAMRKYINVCGAAAAKTVTTPAAPIIKGARSALRRMSINEGKLGKKVEVEDGCDDAVADEEIAVGDDNSDEALSSATGTRSSVVSDAASTISVSKSPVSGENAGLVEYNEVKTVAATEDVIVRALPAPGFAKRKTKLIKLTRKLTKFTTRTKSTARA